MLGNCKATYNKLSGQRNVYLDRARAFASVTIPSLMLEEGHNESTKIHTPYSSVSAVGVQNLASKLQMALFPPNQSFFKMDVDRFTLMELTGGDPTRRAEVDEQLSHVERAVMSEMEKEAMRSPIFEALRHLIVTGNYLLHLGKEGVKGYSLDKFVVTRDPEGKVKQVIIKEEFHIETLPEDVLALTSFNPNDSGGADKPVAIYTKFYRDGKRWKTYQEVEDQMIPGTEGSYPIDEPPFMPLRWTAIAGEHYGRAHVEAFYGDIRALEGLSKAIVDASTASARLLVMVNPTGVTNKKQVAEAQNGAVITGAADDVQFMQTQKGSDMAVASQQVQRLEMRISQAFLSEQGALRDGERVTAEEVRMRAQQLENTLGGVYSVLSNELQLPLVRRLLAQMQKAKKLPELPKDVVEPSIVTGLDALGRGHDLNKYMQLLQAMAPLGPEALGRVNMGDLIKRVGVSLGLEMDGLIFSDQEIQQQQAQAMEQQAQQMMMQAGANAVSQPQG
jgi:hypothetical protein